MNLRPATAVPDIEQRTFWLLIAAVSLAFAWIVRPFYGAVLWAIVFAVLFAPVFRRLTRAMRHQRTWAALATMTIILLMVILPVLLITALLIQESLSAYARLQAGDLNLGGLLQQMQAALPAWATQLLDRLGLTDLASIQQKISESLTKAIQFIGPRAIGVGRITFEFLLGFFVMLYLLFFLLRDGDQLVRKIKNAIPLRDELQRDLSSKFVTVIRATVKGSILVAMLQGALGGLIFWFLGIQAPVLWGVVMAFLSLLPAVGAALVWGPVAIYLLATGSICRALF